MHGEQLIVRRGRGNIQFICVHALHSRAAFDGQAAAGAIHEDAAHGLGGGGEEMLAPLPGALVGAGHLEPGFMHERGGLEGVLVRLARQPVRGDLAQLFIDERKQLAGGVRIARLQSTEQLSDVGHEREGIVRWTGKASVRRALPVVAI